MTARQSAALRECSARMVPPEITANNGVKYRAVCVQYEGGYSGDGYGFSHFMNVPFPDAAIEKERT